MKIFVLCFPPIDNNSVYVHIMAFHRIVNKPLPERMVTHFIDTSMHHPASMCQVLVILIDGTMTMAITVLAGGPALLYARPSAGTMRPYQDMFTPKVLGLSLISFFSSKCLMRPSGTSSLNPCPTEFNFENMEIYLYLLLSLNKDMA